MNKSNKKVRTIHILPSVLGASFISLKLMGDIEWSWLWVLSPLWVEFLFGFFVGLYRQLK